MAMNELQAQVALGASELTSQNFARTTKEGDGGALVVAGGEQALADGQLVATLGDEIVGYATSLIVQLDDESPWYSYNEITGGGTFSTHDPSGDTLYGADIAVHPDHRGKGVAGALYKGRKSLLRRLNLRRMVAGGRIPGHAEHAGKMTAEQYVDRVVAGELSDPALNAHVKAGYHVRSIHMGYLRDDQSLDYATFLELENAEYRAARRRISAAPMKRPMRPTPPAKRPFLMAEAVGRKLPPEGVANSLYRFTETVLPLVRWPRRWVRNSHRRG